MFNKFYSRGKNFVATPQTTVLSAAVVIMTMVMFSTILGLVRQRLFLHFFKPEELSLFLAAFRLPDLVFQVLAYGMFSSAFIPVFTKTYKKDPKLAFETSSKVLSISLVLFLLFAALFMVFADYIYGVFAPGYSPAEIKKIVELARILIVAQSFFVASYVMTGVLESTRRFLVPALAPIFYNLGIILTTILLTQDFHLMAPAIGAVIGSFLHLAIQLPTARSVGFRFRLDIFPNAQVKKVGKLALPRVVELLFLEASKISELFLTSIIASAALTYYSLADSLRTLPVTLFGVSLAKAALPTLASQEDDPVKFKKTFLSTLYQIEFLVIPVAALLIVLRIPVVRILFGTDIFNWEATVQTGMVLSAFALSIPFQSASTLLSRAFYATHDTKTPVKLSIAGVAISLIIGVYLVFLKGYPTWALAFAYSVGMMIQSTSLYVILSRRLNGGTIFAVGPIIKSTTASVLSGLTMFFIIKFFDRSVWVKRLSFLGNIKSVESLNFESFVVDTRYTGNLIALTAATALIGMFVYVLVSYLFRSKELFALFRLVSKRSLAGPGPKEAEYLTRSNTENP